MKQKNFKEIYDAIYASCGKVMEEKRKKALWKSILTFVIIILIWVFIIRSFIQSGNTSALAILFILLFISIIVAAIITSRINKDYKNSYKQQIINEIVENSNSTFKYDPKKGIGSSEYAASGFDYGWDRYHTEDFIIGELEDGSKIKMAQVHTEEEHETTDSDGHTTTSYVTTFLGLYGIIKLKTATKADFMIKNNSKLAKFNKKRIEMESAEFEKYYDVYSGTKDSGVRQNAMEILTPEAIEEFVKIRNLFKRPINVRVYNGTIYFRIAVGDIFEPPTFRNSMNFEMLRKYFLIIDVPRMIYETLIDNILVMYGDKEARENRILANMTDEQKEEYKKDKQTEEEESYFLHN